MCEFIHCRIWINDTDNVQLVETCSDVDNLMHKHWDDRIRCQYCGKAYADISKTKPILDLIYSLETDGSMSELTEFADVVFDILNMNDVYDATIV